jgi:hypothetical protein
MRVSDGTRATRRREADPAVTIRQRIAPRSPQSSHRIRRNGTPDFWESARCRSPSRQGSRGPSRGRIWGCKPFSPAPGFFAPRFPAAARPDAADAARRCPPLPAAARRCPTLHDTVRHGATRCDTVRHGATRCAATGRKSDCGSSGSRRRTVDRRRRRPSRLPPAKEEACFARLHAVNGRRYAARRR